MKSILLTLITVWALMDQCLGQGNTLQPVSAQISGKLLNDTTLNPQSNNESGNLLANVRKQRVAPWYASKFSVGAGFFFVINNTDVKVTNAAGKGTDISFENDLGFNKSSSSFMGGFQWRTGAKSRIDLQYINVDRSSSYNLQRTIDFGDHIYDINSTVSAYFNTGVYRLSYGYAFFQNKDYELGAMLGFHILTVKLGMSLVGANVNSYADTYKVTAPLPDFGIWGGWVPAPRWALTGEVGWLKVTIDKITGRILTGGFVVNFQAVESVKIALGYTGFGFSVDKKSTREGNLTWGYNGPSLTVVYMFGRKSWK